MPSAAASGRGPSLLLRISASRRERCRSSFVPLTSSPTSSSIVAASLSRLDERCYRLIRARVRACTPCLHATLKPRSDVCRRSWLRTHPSLRRGSRSMQGAPSARGMQRAPLRRPGGQPRRAKHEESGRRAVLRWLVVPFLRRRRQSRLGAQQASSPARWAFLRLRPRWEHRCTSRLSASLRQPAAASSAS